MPQELRKRLAGDQWRIFGITQIEKSHPEGKGGGGNGKGPRLRCGDPNHRHRDCPLPEEKSLIPK